MSSKISKEKLSEILHYNSETGIFTWLVHRKGTRGLGSIAGTLTEYGYVRIKIDGKDYRAHRLAWFYVNGEMPDIIDHINGKRSDNRICNLRVASKSQNQHNRKIDCTSSTGIKGVRWQQQSRKWRVEITVKDKKHYFGLHEDIEFAELVANTAREKYHGIFANHGGEIAE